MPLTLTRHPHNPLFVCRGDTHRPVHLRQWYEFPGRNDGIPETWCYTDRLSYSPGERVTVLGISTVKNLQIAVERQCISPQRVLSKKIVRATWCDTPAMASRDGCQWPAISEFDIGSDWPSGVYRIVVESDTVQGSTALAEHLFIVRPGAVNRQNRFLFITSDATWNAYNDWGGSNHYEGIIDSDSNQFSPRLSSQRPFARGFISLPINAPRTIPDMPPQERDELYPHMEWSWRNGYSKKYASAGWPSYEKHFLHWAESRGYQFDVATQQDVHFRPEVLDGYHCAVIVGHDEYWSWEMRDHIDSFVEQGGRVARFGGNFLWQIRLEEQGEIQVCHKYRALEEDPLRNSAYRRLTTSCWESELVGRPGHMTFGLDATRGMYAGWGGLAPQGAGGFTLYRPDHWALAGSGLGYGDIVGSSSRIFGYEVDGLGYRIEDGLPFPEAIPTLPDDLEIIAVGLARMREDEGLKSGASLFVGDDDAEFIAKLRYGNSTEESLQRVDRGSGMIVNFTKGKGEVFNAGTTEWVAGLLRGDHAVQKITENVIEKFLL